MDERLWPRRNPAGTGVEECLADIDRLAHPESTPARGARGPYTDDRRDTGHAV
jgi:hypothetical protein